MIHLKYKCEVNFVKLPLIWIDLYLKLVFENATAGRNTACRSFVNCARCSLQLPLTVSDAVCCIENATKQCISRYHLHTVNQFFHPFPYTIIQWAKVWRPGWPIVGNARSDPFSRVTKVQEISNFTWRMRRSSVMLEIRTTSFIQRHILQKSGQFLLQKFEVHLFCKMTFQDERTNESADYPELHTTHWHYKVVESCFPQWRGDSHLPTHESCVYYWHRRDWIAQRQ